MFDQLVQLLISTEFNEFLFGPANMVQAIGPLGALGIGVGFGLLKNLLVDQPRAEARRGLAAETARLSPFTGLRPDLSGTQAASPLETGLQFGVTGLALQQNVAQADLAREALKKGKGSVSIEAGGGNAAALAATGLGLAGGPNAPAPIGVVQPTLLPPSTGQQLAAAGVGPGSFQQFRAQGGF